MIFDTTKIIKSYPWLIQKELPMIISSNYDGLICASLLHHYFDWNLVGYYNHESLWISDEAIKRKKEVIWVDLNILPKQGKAIGGQIVSVDGYIPNGFETSCNPNILNGLTSENFSSKFPFSTLIFLMWLHNIEIPKDDIAKLFILNSDASWLKWQHYSNNCKKWTNILSNYDWKSLFKEVDNKNFDKKIDQILHPELSSISKLKKYGKLTSKYLNLKNREFLINPDWDEDLIHHFFNLISTHMHWSNPQVPQIVNRIDGQKNTIYLKEVKKNGLNKFIDQKNIFSYAITSPQKFSYTSFGKTKKRIIDGNN